MNVLFVGDVVGSAGVTYLLGRLPALRGELDVDVVVANAENAAPNGHGLSVEALDALTTGGVDVITGGNHSWQSERGVLEHPHVLRPHNVAPDAAGRGLLTLDVGGEPLTVVNLAGTDVLDGTPETPAVSAPPYHAFRDARPQGAVIVDLHANHVFEKQVFAHAVDGLAAGVLGTHTHEATVAVHRLPRGTALVTEVGMTGRSGGVMGFGPEGFTAALDGRQPVFRSLPSETGAPVLGAILLRVAGGRTRDVRRIR